MEGQVWVVLTLFSIVGVVTCIPSAKPQLVYNSDGTPRLEIINTGAVGQPLQGRWSWQTPEGTSVWIQYPLNHQGFVPWTPAEYTYSVSSGATRNTQIANHVHNQHQRLRSDRRIDTQITNNNDQSTALGQNLDTEDKFPSPLMDKLHGPITEKFTGPVTDKLHGPVMEKFPGPVTDKLHGPVFEKLPVRDMDKHHGPVFEKLPGSLSDILHGPVFEKFPSPVSDILHGPVFEKFPGPVSDIVHGPVMEKFPGPVSDKIHGPVMEKFPGPVSDKIHGPVMEKFPGPVMDKFFGPTESQVEVFTGRSIEDEDSTNGEFIPVTESFFENYVFNELDSTNFVGNGDQIEDTTDLGPLVRFTSRGRPQISKKIPEKPAIYPSYTSRPSTKLNAENRFRPRRPGITDNGIARLLTLPEEDSNSNRGVARSSPSSLRFNNRYSRVIRVEY